MKNQRQRFSYLAVRGALPLVVLTLGITGCSSGSSGSATPPTGTSANSGQVSNYFGTQATSSASFGGIWALSFDSSTRYFSYVDVSQETSIGFGLTFTPNGVDSTVGDFLDLGTLNNPGVLGINNPGGAKNVFGGYAVDLPGDGVLVRPGDSTHTVIGATVSNVCPAFTKPETFNFVTMGATDGAGLNTNNSLTDAAYGSMQLLPGPNNSWTFPSQKMFLLDGTAVTPPPISGGTCASTQEGYVISVPFSAMNAFQDTTYQSVITIGVSPSGLLAVDQGQITQIPYIPPSTGPFGLVGVQQPAAALNTSDMVGKSYAGFESEPLGPLGTVAVVFRAGNASGGTATSIVGGDFPNDDITLTPAMDTMLNLGSQSTSMPGLYPSVTLTRPDTFSKCAGQTYGGMDAQGNATCIFHGAAVVGQVNGKYVIYANIGDPSNKLVSSPSGGGPTTGQPLVAVLNLFLFQH